MLSHTKQFVSENAGQLKKIAAEGTVGGAAYGYTLNEWVAISTIGYIFLQAAYLAWKWIKELKKDGK